MDQQDEETIRILKIKHELENLKIKVNHTLCYTITYYTIIQQKGRNNVQQEKQLEQKRDKVQRNKKMLMQNVMENQQKMHLMKKKNRDILYQESKNIDAEKLFIK